MPKIRPCKACGKEVSTSASTCPHCGQKLKMGFFAKFAIGLAALILIIIALPKPDKENNSSSANAGEGQNKSSVSLPSFSALDIARAYEANTVAADQQFKDKRFKVTGTITDINTDLMGDPYITMPGTNELLEPQFAFDKEHLGQLANLRKGEQVTLICTGQGDIAKTPMSDSCEIAPAESNPPQSRAPALETEATSSQASTPETSAVSFNNSECVQGIDGAPALNSEYEGGIYLCREPVEIYWNDWYAFPLMARNQLPTNGQAELQVKSEGKTSGFNGNLSINCENGKYSWKDASNFDEPLGTEQKIMEILPSQVVINAKKIACT